MFLAFPGFQITYWKQPAEFKYWILNFLFIYKPLLNKDNGNAAPVSNNLEWKVDHWNSAWIFRISVTASYKNLSGLTM